MVTISLFWFGVLVLMSAVLGYLAGTAHSAYIGETEYHRGAVDAVQVMKDHLEHSKQDLYNDDNDDNDDNQPKARMGFDTTQKGETK